MGGKVERWFLPTVIGFAPFALMLATWAPDGRAPLQRLTLAFYLPIVAMELFVVAIALREGLIPAMKRWSWARVPSAALILLLAIAICTAAAAPAPFAARVWTAFWLLHLAFGLAITHLATRILAPLDVSNASLAGFVVFVAGAVLFAASVRDPQFDWTHSWPASTHIRHLGYYAAAMTASCIGLFAGGRSRPSAGLLLTLITIGFAFALWTGSRGAVVAVAGALILGLLAIPVLRWPIVWAGTLVSLAIGALIASQMPASGPWMGFNRTVTQTVSGEDVSSGRTEIWTNAWGAIRERPIFGYGENQMATVAPFHGLGQTHNVILQVLLAWGFVGLLCVGVLSIWFLIRSLPVVRRNAVTLAPSFMAMAALASLAAIDGTLFHVVPVSIFAACAGLIASRWPSHEHAPEAGRVGVYATEPDV